MSERNMHTPRFELLEDSPDGRVYYDHKEQVKLRVPPIVASQKAEGEPGAAGSDPVLPVDGDPTTVSVAEQREQFMKQLAELADLLTMFARSSDARVMFTDPTPQDKDIYYDASKALYRAADRIRRVADDYS